MSDRDAYVQKMKAKIDEWSADLTRLEAKAETAKAEAKIEYHDQIGSLKKQREEAREKLRELERASEDAWESLRGGMEAAWENIGRAFKDAVNRFK
ncbi:MAG: coiled coil domain-containing protein [Burkholderiales bacterium]